MKINWIIRDNAGHDVLSYEPVVDNKDLSKGIHNYQDYDKEVIGVTFYTNNFQQRNEIINLVDKWNEL